MPFLFTRTDRHQLSLVTWPTDSTPGAVRESGTQRWPYGAQFPPCVYSLGQGPSCLCVVAMPAWQDPPKINLYLLYRDVENNDKWKENST